MVNSSHHEELFGFPSKRELTRLRVPYRSDMMLILSKAVTAQVIDGSQRLVCYWVTFIQSPIPLVL
jgi:hypothetical protein